MNTAYIFYKLNKPLLSWKNKYLKHISKRHARRSALYENALQEISEFTGEPVAVVRQKHQQGPENEQGYRQFHNAQTLTAEAVCDFYKGCSFYQYELPLWNAQVGRPRYLSLLCRPYLDRYGYKKILDFGAGTGDFSMELALQGYDVSYCDIGKKNFAFAQWRFRRRDLPVKMYQGLDLLPKNEHFDCIFSFDAFEHIKGLPEVIGSLVRHLNPGGSLIFSGAFSGGSLHLEENNRYDDFAIMDRLLIDNGLEFRYKCGQHLFYKSYKQKTQRG